ncbi:hypothetical protein HDV00_010510 [Rhizophlyctis rosea]|nr:hypothetical protein HDV00_010510 [Rhizophlyctis rosea]
MGGILSREGSEVESANKGGNHIPPDVLEQILEGKTCTPLSLMEFREYLTTTEFSEENLDAYEWFQAYRKRFYSLPRSQQSLSPPLSSPAHSVDPSHQPLRAETTAALSLFFCASAPQEVNIPHKVQEKLRIDLQSTTHPDVFEEAIRYVVELMRRRNLPGFLRDASSNIGSWREIAKRWVTGSAYVGLSIGFLILLLYFHQSRWYRLFILPPIYMALLYFQTAQRHVCLHYMGRRQREVLITETPGDKNTQTTKRCPFTGAKDVETGFGNENWEMGDRTKAAKLVGRVVGRTFKGVEEPIVVSVQQAVKRRYLLWALIGDLIIVVAVLGIPEDIWMH